VAKTMWQMQREKNSL